MKLQDLHTSFEKDFNRESPLPEYPRPQFRRESYINLNGLWKFELSKKDVIPDSFTKEIIVPYPLESRLSEVQRHLKKGEYIYYQKMFFVNKTFKKDRVILHIDGVDQIAHIYVNRYLVGVSKNGYLPYEVDITPYLNNEENSLIVQVRDDLSHRYPYGKQKKNRGGMWYTPVSGIWKTVWLESVNNHYFKSVKITPLDDLSGLHLELDTNIESKLVSVIANGKTVYEQIHNSNSFDIEIKEPHLWSPDDPFLYDLRLEGKTDEVMSYFALRKIEVRKDKLVYLNGKRIFLNGLLDQGYYPEGIYTPSVYKEYAFDILTMKNLGFNVLRKHIKIEPLYFYYLCDSYGMLVFQDMVNNSDYSFLVDTAFATISKKKKLNDKKRHIKNRKEFLDSAEGTVNLLYNSPCIVLWTIFNEGWGQFDANAVHDIFYQFDNTRLVDDTSGWFQEGKNMFESMHVYFKPVVLSKTDKPLLLTEFGGYSYKLREHSFNLSKTYGYRKYNDQKSFEDGFVELYEKEIIPYKNQLCGTIYTQVSDVEDETNGLLTYDREVLKVDAKRISNLMKKLYK